MSSYFGNNPYGTLGPSDRRVSTINRRRPTARTSTTRSPQMTAEEWARAQTDRYIESLLKSIQEDRDAYLSSLRRDSDLESQRGMELAKALTALNIPGRVQQIFGNASADIGGLAQGFSGALKNQASADAAQQTRMVSGTGQEGAVRNAGEPMGNVLYGVGGYIPARSLSEAGAAFGAQAALEPSFAARIGQQKASEVYAEGLKGLDEFRRAEQEIRSGRFDMEQDLLDRRQDALNEERDYRLDVAKEAYDRARDQVEDYYKKGYLELAQGNSKRANEYFKLATQKESRMAASARGYDADGNLLPGYTLGPDGLPIKRSDLAKASKPKKDAAKARTSARKEREDEFRKARLDAIEEAKKLITPATTLRPEQRPSYQVAYSRLWNRYKDLLRFAGPGGQKNLRARIDKLIREALAQNGFTKPPKRTPPTRPGDRSNPASFDSPSLR